MAINERGQVVGESDIKAQDEFGYDLSHAFLWQNGAMRDLGTLGGPESTAYAINEQGQVVGESDIKRRTKDGYTIKHAFLWQNGGMTDIGAFKRAPGDRLGLPPESLAFAINERGQILGSSDYGSFVWQQGKRRMIGTLGGRESDADALSDRGEVVGGAETNATKNWPLVSHGFVVEEREDDRLGCAASSRPLQCGRQHQRSEGGRRHERPVRSERPAHDRMSPPRRPLDAEARLSPQ